MTTTQPNPLAISDEVERQIASDFRQRGMRLLPLTQEDLDAARNRADAQFREAAQRETANGLNLGKSAQRAYRFINQMQLSKALIDALNRRRT